MLQGSKQQAPSFKTRDNIKFRQPDSLFPHARPWGQPQQNWIKALPDKGWFAYFRFYGPTQPYFDRTWALPDIVEVK